MSLLLFPSPHFRHSIRRHPFQDLFRTIDAIQRQFEDIENVEPRPQPPQQQVALNDHGFHVNLDVSAFKPEELTIRLEEDQLVIDGEHKEETEQGSLHRQFHRSIRLPEGIDIDSFKSELSQEGRLSIHAPLIEKKQGRSIPIQMARQEQEKSESQPSIEQ